MQRRMLCPIVETPAREVVDEAFGGRAFRQQERVLRQFDVVIDEALRHMALANDGEAVHQGAGLDQPILDQDRMLG